MKVYRVRTPSSESLQNKAGGKPFINDLLQCNHEGIIMQNINNEIQTSKQEDQHDWRRKTVMFLTGQTITLFGSMLVQYAMIWYITLTTKSGTMMMISTLCGFVPQILISLPAGVWADRYDRKKLIILSDSMIAFSTLILAVIWLSGFESLWLLFIISAIRSLGAGIQTPAVSAILPQLVPQDKLMRVNGINGSIQGVTMIAAPVVSGAMMTVFSLSSIFFFDVVTAVIGISMLSIIKIPLHAKALEQSNTNQRQDMKEGFLYIWHHPFLKTLIGFYFFIMLLIVPAALLTPLLTVRKFGDEVWRLTLIEVAFSGGAVIGGLMIAIWRGFKNRILTINLAALAFGLLTASMGIANVFWLFLLLMIITGIMLPFYNTSSTTLLQERIETNMQGRVFSLVQVGSSTAFPLGIALFGPLSDAVPIDSLLVVTGLLLVLIAGLMLTNRKLRCAEGGCEDDLGITSENSVS